MMFFNKLHEKILSCKTRLCIGIDPFIPTESPLLKHGMGVAEVVEKSVGILIEQAVAHNIPAVKFQSAYFEALGTEGFAVLHRAITNAKAAHLITILDAKRGDIASTMQAYGRFAFEYMNADCLTITPYMGIDTVEPLVPWLKSGRGIYVVWATSNKSAESLQFLATGKKRFFENVYEVINTFAENRSLGPAIGYVLGATKLGAEEIRSALTTMTQSSFLLPGVGAQGGEVDAQLRDLLSLHPSSLVPISREIGEITAGIRSMKDYEQAVAAAVGRLKNLLAV